MTKRKLMLVALSLCMVAILAIGGSLAYFTDTTDVKENVFTVGKVDIDLEEEFEQKSKLFPGVDVNKDVKVTVAKDSEEAYVRVHIAFPTILDSGVEDDPAFAAFDNLLHWNFTTDSIKEGQWNWSTTTDGKNYPGNGGAWNFYTTNVDGISYNVYVATYETALSAGETTATQSLDKVYLDTELDNEHITELKKTLGENWKILVVAEGCQKEGFDDAYEALNTSFGKPGTYDPFNTKTETAQ